jgi:hypothetical protein
MKRQIMIRFLPVVLLASTLAAQTPPDVALERQGFLAWLKKASNSPLSAVAQQRVGSGVRLGPADSDIPLPGIEQHRVFPSSGSFVIEGPGGQRPIGPGRPYRIGKYTLYLTGPRSGTVLSVFADSSAKEPPGYYDYDTSLVFTGPLVRAKSPEQVRILAWDGLEAQAMEAGTFVVPLGGHTPLRVLRVPVAGGEESVLEIFFRDGTNGNGSYPAGRFVSLIPAGAGTFRLDFNRARNPFCAYSPVYACPLPWRGNVIAEPIRAGERYSGGGLETTAAGQSPK